MRLIDAYTRNLEDERNALAAEVSRLKAEVERLEAEIERLKDTDLTPTVDELL